METTLDLEGGKYTVVYNSDGHPKEILRFGDDWITPYRMDNGHIQLAVALLNAQNSLSELRQEHILLNYRTS
jgi:hypothetical protein